MGMLLHDMCILFMNTKLNESKVKQQHERDRRGVRGPEMGRYMPEKLNYASNFKRIKI
jgi:hypothetical protein